MKQFCTYCLSMYVMTRSLTYTNRTSNYTNLPANSIDIVQPTYHTLKRGLLCFP